VPSRETGDLAIVFIEHAQDNIQIGETTSLCNLLIDYSSMTDMRLQPSELSRRRLLGLFGAAGAASGAIGSTAAASETPGAEPSVDLFAFTEDRCRSDDCPGAEYVLPTGLTVDFGAYVTGSSDKAASVLVDQSSGQITVLESCPSDTPFEPCREFTVTLDEPGLYAVRYFAGGPESGPLVPSEPPADVPVEEHDDGSEEPDDPETPLPDCETSDAIACDSITIAAVDPTVDLTATRLGEPAPIRTGDTLVVEGVLDPLLEADSWEIETAGVPTEDAAVPDVDVPPGVARWGKRPLGPGTLELTVTAIFGNTTVHGSTEVSVESTSGLSVGDSKLSVDGTTLAGEVELANETEMDRSVTVSLLASDGDTETTVEQRDATLRSGEQLTLEFVGTAPEDAQTASLVLGDELLARQSLDTGESPTDTQ
jgi:hypothetical protein